MKKSLTATVQVLLVLCLVLCSVSCSRVGLKNELTKYYQSEWSRLVANFSVAHFKSKILVAMDTMSGSAYSVATERDAIADELAREYCDSYLFTDMADVALPFYENHLTVVEFKKINATVYNETPLSIMRKIDSIMDRDFSHLVNVAMSAAVADIMNGETPKLPSLPEEVAKNYLPLMERFYEVSGRRIITENGFTAMKDMINQEASESQILAENFFEYLSNATPIMMCIAMEGELSSDELSSLIDIFESPEFVKLKEATMELSNDILKTNKMINERFDRWLIGKL